MKQTNRTEKEYRELLNESLRLSQKVGMRNYDLLDFTFRWKKENYIRGWISHINTLYALAMCSDEKLSKEIKRLIRKLTALVLKIAETKSSTELEGSLKELNADINIGVKNLKELI